MLRATNSLTTLEFPRLYGWSAVGSMGFFACLFCCRLSKLERPYVVPLYLWVLLLWAMLAICVLIYWFHLSTCNYTTIAFAIAISQKTSNPKEKPCYFIFWQTSLTCTILSFGLAPNFSESSFRARDFLAQSFVPSKLRFLLVLSSGFIQTFFLLVQLQAASILFVDNPVGTGFSYVDDCNLFAKNLSTVVSDMMVFLGEFFSRRTEFQVSELSSWLESYFSLLLNRSQKELVNRLPDG